MKKNIILVLLVLILPLTLAEIGLRLVKYYGPNYAPGNEKGRGAQAVAHKKYTQAKINNLWIQGRENRKHLFEPPFDVFVNKDFADENRLQAILPYALMPVNQSWDVENFLRRNNTPPVQTHHITSNSYGYRGENFGLEKDKNTTRIVVLGSYPAFGHAVNDEETYSSVLQKNLNANSKKRKFEVWNAGRQGATSIMGYAKLKYEVPKLKPDLLIWDFGWIELYLALDMIDIKNRQQMKQDNPATPFVTAACSYILDYSSICKFLMNRLYKINKDDALEGWRESMRLLKKWALENKIPVVFLKHKGVTVPIEEYIKFDSPKENFYFLDTSVALTEEKLTSEEIEEFWSKPNWLSEVDFTKDEILKGDRSMMFLGDSIQYNKFAYRRFGNLITKFIDEKNLLKK